MLQSSSEFTELIFNILYLIVIWFMVFKMYQKKPNVKLENLLVSNKFLLAFLYLAIGDTGHVGFRVIAYLKGGIENNSYLVGYGSLATAITITFFYMLILEAYRLRYKQSYSLIICTLISVGVLRLIIILFPQNNWGSITPPYNWSILRNIPLLIQGIGTAALILKHSLKHDDKIFKWISIMIFISYTFYIPVILFIHTYPAIGMLMIPKTIAYIAAGLIGYYGLFTNSSPSAFIKCTM